jgi:hypothetical protein
MISTKPELLEELLEPPRLPAVLDPRPEELDDPVDALDALDPVELPAETAPPGEMSSTETTVPEAGA